MKPYRNGLLLQPTFGKAVGSSPYHQVEGNQHRVKSLAGGGQQPSAVQRPDGIEAHDTGKPVASDDKMTAETIAATKPQHTPTVSPTEPVEAGKGGEGGDFQLTNAEFIAAVFTDLPEGAFAAVCSKSGDPSLGGWSASRADKVANGLAAENNNYVGCSSFYPGNDGSFKARKAQFAGCHFLMHLSAQVIEHAWSDYCRYPLMWLGHPDPATALLEQVRHDPDGDALCGLMTEWHAV